MEVRTSGPSPQPWLRRIGSESEPPQSPTETSRESARNRPPWARLWFGTAVGRRPKPREQARISARAGAEGAQSPHPRTTWRWGQSGANPSLGLGSLIRRENTGNSPGFEGTGGRRGAENARSPGTLGEISLGSGAGNDGPAIRELPAGRQGSPLDSFQAGDPEQPLPTPDPEQRSSCLGVATRATFGARASPSRRRNRGLLRTSASADTRLRSSADLET